MRDVGAKIAAHGCLVTVVAAAVLTIGPPRMATVAPQVHILSVQAVPWSLGPAGGLVVIQADVTGPCPANSN